jgi:ABC-type branched-subunit amino acid transport system ATPase component
MTVLENLMVAQHNPLMRASGYTVFGLLGLPGLRRAEREAVDFARYWLDQTKPHRQGRLAGRRACPTARSAPGDRARHVHAPVLLCLDEPAAGLNPRESAELKDAAAGHPRRAWHRLLLIEHDMSVVMKISDHVVVLDYGRQDLRRHAGPDPLRSRGHPRLSRRGRGGRAAARGRRRPGAGGAALMLSIQGVSTSYGNIQALQGVDIEVGQGEIVTLIGANGAGKTTLLMTVCGKPRATAGRIVFDGRDITKLPTFEIVRQGIAQAPEGRRIFARMTVLENLQMGAIVADKAHFAQDCARMVSSCFPSSKERQGCSAPARCRAASSRCCPSAAR